MILDHYQALGVQPDASPATIRQAYLRLMRAHHPDRRPGDPDAAERARRANQAWEVLGDRARRAAYDRLRTTRTAGVRERPGARLHRSGDAAVTASAYSPERRDYRQAFHQASLRVGVGIFVVGMLVLLALS